MKVRWNTWEKMASRMCIAREKSMHGFEAPKSRLTLSGTNAADDHCSKTIGSIKIVLTVPPLWSVTGITKP
jgi:hypothetical protein